MSKPTIYDYLVLRHSGVWKYESPGMRSNNSCPPVIFAPHFSLSPSLIRNITLLYVALAAKIFYSTCSSIIVRATGMLSRYNLRCGCGLAVIYRPRDVRNHFSRIMLPLESSLKVV